jgi:hypothetical protein
MSTTKLLAKHFRDVHFGGNWTFVNLKDQLADVSWGQATAKMDSFNSILALVYHINYYVTAILNVLKGTPLSAHDKYSFDHPVINSQEEWEKFLQKIWSDAETFATLVEQLPDDKLWELMADEKYGHWFRNLFGIIEHTHYHLGQIVILKKLLKQRVENN